MIEKEVPYEASKKLNEYVSSRVSVNQMFIESKVSRMFNYI